MEVGTRVQIADPDGDTENGKTGIVTDVDTAPGGRVLLTIDPDGTPSSVGMRRFFTPAEVRVL